MTEPSLNTIRLHDCLNRWQQGDRDAADELLTTVGPRLEALARRMLRGFSNVRSQADTLDVLQNALLRLLTTLRRLRPESVRSFFNLAAVHLRRELIDLARRHKPGLSDAARDVEAVDPADDREEAELELWCRFHEAVEGLEVEEREIVGLVFYHGWTQAQVAEFFQVNVRTIRRRWASACANLQTALDGQFPDNDGGLVP